VLTYIIAAQINEAAELQTRKGLDMQSTMMMFVRQRGCASKTFNSASCLAAIGLTGFAMAASPASALVTGAGSSLQQQLKQDSPVVEVRARAGGHAVRGGGAVRRTTVVGPRGGAASRTVVRGGAVARPGVVRAGVVRPGGWVRPAHYTWRPGGAIAAGAAIGFVAAASAAAWAGSPPAPGYCWYYTDPSRTQGFWDACP
jgi:hypothetical protein